MKKREIFKGINLTSAKQHPVTNTISSIFNKFKTGNYDFENYSYKILVIFFLKYISDTWKELYTENSGDIDKTQAQTGFVLPKGTSFYDLVKQRDAKNIGELVNQAFKKIEEYPGNDFLSGIFSSVDFGCKTDFEKKSIESKKEVDSSHYSNNNRQIEILLEEFNCPQLDFSFSNISHDILGDIFTYLIFELSADQGKRGGEFMTPPEISKLVAALVRPSLNDLVYDPACGTGYLLLTVKSEVENGKCSLFGQELHHSTWALAKMNMILHGEIDAKIEWGNTLTNPAFTEHKHLKKFNIVVANIPFSSRWNSDVIRKDDEPFNRFERGMPPKSKGDYAFILHMIESALPQKGRVAVVVPHGVLFREAIEKTIRKRLIEDNLLDAVIGLPANLFPGTAIPAAILIFDRSRESEGKHEDREDVIFIDASREYQQENSKNHLKGEEIYKIIKTYTERKNIGKYSHVVSLEEIIENDFNLNVSRYVDTFEYTTYPPPSEIKKEMEELEQELNKVREKISRCLSIIGEELA